MTEQPLATATDDASDRYERLSETTLRRMNRRTFAAVAAGSGAAGVGIARLAFAQTTDSTPAADTTTTGTPEAGVSASDRMGGDRMDDLIAEFDARVTALQGDVTVAGSSVDATTINAVIADAQTQKAAAEAAVTASDTETAMRSGFAAAGELRVARLLLEAQLSYAGLPSEENRSGRVLAHAYEQITAAGDAATADTSVDVAFQVTTAQSVYTQAYDLYGSSAFAQAALNGRAASDLASIGLVLLGKGGGMGGGFDEGEFGMGGHRRMIRREDKEKSSESESSDATPDASTDDQSDDSTTPVTPPAPDFGS